MRKRTPKSTKTAQKPPKMTNLTGKTYYLPLIDARDNSMKRVKTDLLVGVQCSISGEAEPHLEGIRLVNRREIEGK